MIFRTVPAFLRCGTSLQRWKPLSLSRRLALFIASLHRNTVIWAGRVDRAFVVFEESARCSTGDYQASPDISSESIESFRSIVVGNEVSVSVEQLRFTHQIEVISFDDQVSFAAGSA